MPRVSIVLPNYNYARYLDERIRSLLDQTYTDFELVIVDDASADESLAVIKRFDDDRIRLHLRSENSGKVYASWNEGLTLCRGDLVLFAGADDSAEASMVEHLVAPFDENPGLGFSHCRYLLIDADGRIIATQPALPFSAAPIVEDLQRDYVATAPQEWRRLLVTNFIWNASGVLFNRSALESIGCFEEDLMIAADWLAYLAISREHDVAYVSNPLNAFRQLAKSVSKRLQGAQLMDEIFICLSRQEKYIKSAVDREYFEAGLENADAGLRHFIAANGGAGNHEEVEKLLAVASKYQREAVCHGP